jgi:putative transposase
LSHTYSANLVHCVFSTKNREGLIPECKREKLWAYLAGIAHNEHIGMLAAGGTDNHIHLLMALPPSQALAEAVQSLKGNSSKWMGRDFSWQEGYGAFSVSPSQKKRVQGYIHTQAEHHRKHSFEDEFRELLEKCGIAYDPAYVFG